MKAIKTILTCCLALMAFSRNEAQVTANFTVDVDKGCSPLIVSFTNTSTGSGTLTYSWDFGLGIDHKSDLKDPKAVYANPGNYTVKLTVSNGTETSTFQKSLVVYKNPVAKFTADKTPKGCTPFNLTFSDVSEKGDANITQRNWDFRNGVISSDPSPQVAYSSAGKFDVFLEVTDANGCKSNSDKDDYVDIVAPPTVSFIATPPSACAVPASIKFTNFSTGGGTLSYAWDFGDGKTSVIQSPTNVYSVFKTYNVKLTVNSSYGCSASLEGISIVVGEVNAQGTLKQGPKTITDNSIVCAGEIDFNSLIAGNTNVLWDFGDNTTSSSTSGKHLYFKEGKYRILLIAAPNSSCADTVKWNVTVEKPVAAFNMTPDQSCNPSANVAFANQSSDNATTYKWTFHDASTATTKDVVKTYTHPGDKDQYVVHQPLNYPVKLLVSTVNGCRDSIEKEFIIHRPTAIFSPSVTQGCAPLLVQFTDVSQSPAAITERKWMFGEGSDQVELSPIATHTYNNPGNYNVKLIARTADGCADTSYIVNIKVGNPVTPDFTVNNTAVCNSQKIGLTASAATGVSRWHYVIGGNRVPACPETQNPLLYMKMDIGELDVAITMENNGCLSELKKEKLIKNDGPVGDFSYAVTCNSVRTVSFKSNLKQTTSFKWEFGDATTDVINANPTHQYAVEGDYTVKLIAFNGSCSDTTEQTVKVRDHQPTFTLKPEVCAGDVVYFNSKLSHKLNNSCNEKYLWDFGDNTQMIRTHKDSVPHSFVNGGVFQVKLYAFYQDGCADSITKPIRVYKPVPGFTTDRSEGCTPLPVTFTDTSTPDVHSIIYWDWDFADGNSMNYTTKVNTVSNLFQNPGEYFTVLTVTDDFGCKAKFEKKIMTGLPYAEFNAVTPKEVCAGTEVQFLLDYPDPDSAIWNFGNNKFVKSIEKPTKFKYTESGNFDVSLKVYKYGCVSDLVLKSGYVQVQKADASFTASDTVFNCFPKMITLTHASGNNTVEGGKWYYGHRDNTSSGYLSTTSYNYTEPGTYLAKLEIRTSYGCADTFSRKIRITGPTGRFGVTPTEACQGDEITYTLSTDTANIFKYEWDLGDGTFAQGNPVKHRYNSVGNKIAKLILYGDKGKCIPPPVENTVHIYEVTAGISAVDTTVCEGTTIAFQNTSLGANSYNWNFGDGATSSSQSPSHLFAPGTYKVTLNTSGLYGCKDTAVKYIVVSRYPTLAVSNDTTICFGGNASLKAISNKDVRWEPATYLTSANIPNPLSNALETTKYIVFATDPASECYRKDSVEVIVQKKPVLEIEQEAGTFVAGSPIKIQVVTEEGAKFKWSPADFLSCSNCPDPVSTARLSTTYRLTVEDKSNCFKVDTVIQVSYTEGEKAFDVPTAFTPSGEAPNNVFKVEGYNIKQLLEFKIYNRWGNMVFSSTDVSKGWDGTYQGKAQPVDSYVYTIKVETFEGRIETKTGTILLLR